MRLFHCAAIALAIAALLASTGGGPGPARAADDPDVMAGDLFVSGWSEIPGGGGSTAGAVYRVRGSTAELYCQSPLSSTDPLWFPRARDVMVDSRGRVVFVGERSSGPFPESKLLRCSGQGDRPELLRDFAPKIVSGLHLRRSTEIVIDDSVDGGTPHLGAGDVYAMAVESFDPSNGQHTDRESVAYDPSTGEWEQGMKLANSTSGAGIDATYAKGATYSTNGNRAGRDREPFRLEVTGEIEGVGGFVLRAAMFGGYTEIGGGSKTGSFEEIARTSFAHDNLLVDNVPSGCDPPPGVSSLDPGGSHPAGLDAVAFDRDFGLVVTGTSSADGASYMSQYGGVWFDDDPTNDGAARYTQNTPAGCLVSRLITWLPIGAGLPARSTIATENGLFGTFFGGPVIRITERETRVVADGIPNAWGIAAYPPYVPVGAAEIAIVIRIDSPVNVVVTGPDGRRIGVVEDGSVVNDFGPDGYVGGPGEPRLLAIRGPAAGEYAVDAVGTGSGPYAVHAYSVDLSKPEGEHVVARGTAAPGGAAEHDFTFADDGRLAFAAAADFTAPVTTATASPAANAAGWNDADVGVALAAADEPGGSGVKEIRYSVNGGPEAVAGGGGATVSLTAERVHVLAYRSVDNAGNREAAKTLTVRIDKTAPDVAFGAPSPAANASGWHRTDVSLPYAVSDAGSGVASAVPASPLLLASEGTAVTASVTAADTAGNAVTVSSPPVRIDKTAPLLTVPADFAVNAIRPAGAEVAFAPQATDASAVTVACAPASGSTFAIGTTTVTCTATDVAGNAVGSSFRIRVKGAPEQIADLADKVAAMLAGRPLGPVLRARLEQAASALIARNKAAACGSLLAFINVVRVSSSWLLTPAQAAELAADARRIRAVLAC